MECLLRRGNRGEKAGGKAASTTVSGFRARGKRTLGEMEAGYGILLKGMLGKLKVS